jgi:hypothetical protein
MNDDGDSSVNQRLIQPPAGIGGRRSWLSCCCGSSRNSAIATALLEESVEVTVTMKMLSGEVLEIVVPGEEPVGALKFEVENKLSIPSSLLALFQIGDENPLADARQISDVCESQTSTALELFLVVGEHDGVGVSEYVPLLSPVPKSRQVTATPILKAHDSNLSVLQGITRCYITRQRGVGLAKKWAEYTLYSKADDSFRLFAKRTPGVNTTYYISKRQDSATPDSPDLVGCVQSNFVGTGAQLR